jgi:hypothetical protein
MLLTKAATKKDMKQGCYVNYKSYHDSIAPFNFTMKPIYMVWYRTNTFQRFSHAYQPVVFSISPVSPCPLAHTSPCSRHTELLVVSGTPISLAENALLVFPFPNTSFQSAHLTCSWYHFSAMLNCFLFWKTITHLHWVMLWSFHSSCKLSTQLYFSTSFSFIS